MCGMIVSCCVWYDRELLLLSRKKDKLYKVYLRKKTLTTTEKYNKVRNFYFHMITQKKKNICKISFKNIKTTFEKLGS